MHLEYQYVGKVNAFYGTPIEMTVTARTIDDLSKKLGISRTTAWKVLHEKKPTRFKGTIMKVESPYQEHSN